MAADSYSVNHFAFRTLQDLVIQLRNLAFELFPQFDPADLLQVAQLGLVDDGTDEREAMALFEKSP